MVGIMLLRIHGFGLLVIMRFVGIKAGAANFESYI
jgi:hypothetical protein